MADQPTAHHRNKTQVIFEFVANFDTIFSQIWNWDSMEATAIELGKELNGLSRPDGYVTVILMKNKKWLAGDCTIDFGISLNTFVGGKFPSENVTFFIDPLMKDAVHIQIFFVL
jgi:hypothetical protein